MKPCLALLALLALTACGKPDAPAPLGADPQRGRIALAQHACVACHIIPGVTGSKVHVGPPLAGLSKRKLIAGKLPSSPENLVRWIREPHAIAPGSAMPDMGVDERDARDMAAYLLTMD